MPAAQPALFINIPGAKKWRTKYVMWKSLVKMWNE